MRFFFKEVTAPAAFVHRRCNGHFPILMAVLLLAFTGCGFFGGNTTQPIANKSAHLRSLVPAIDMTAKMVLDNMHQHAWNPGAMSRGAVTGGLFINWKMDDPSKTNIQSPGVDKIASGEHDPQVDLLYLTALAEHSQLHPQDHTYDADQARMIANVLTDFKNYSLPKGWIYFYLRKDGLLLNNAALAAEADSVAGSFYTSSYDAVLGYVYYRAHTPALYDTFQSLQCGAALVDAGIRLHQPDWVTAGQKTLDHIIAVGLNPTYHLFYDRMDVHSGGQDRPETFVAKPSTQGQAVDALVTVYTLTHRQQYLDIATQVLQSLYGSSKLWDQQRGGFFFALDMSSGKVDSAYKETRSQSLALIALHHYDMVGPLHFTQQEQQLVSLLTNQFYQGTYHGFFYRVTSDFQVYVSAPGQGIGREDYFTTEAMGTVLDSLQQFEQG